MKCERTLRWLGYVVLALHLLHGSPHILTPNHSCCWGANHCVIWSFMSVVCFLQREIMLKLQESDGLIFLNGGTDIWGACEAVGRAARSDGAAAAAERHMRAGAGSRQPRAGARPCPPCRRNLALQQIADSHPWHLKEVTAGVLCVPFLACICQRLWLDAVWRRCAQLWVLVVDKQPLCCSHFLYKMTETH